MSNQHNEAHKGPEIAMKVDRANEQYPKPPRREPTIVEAEIKPIKRTARTTIVAVLQGGPHDGMEIDVDQMAMEHKAVVEVDPDTVPPFVFDAEARRRGEPNILRGTHDTVTYKRTKEKNAEGATIFQAVA